MRSLSSLLLEKESLTFADLQDCLGVRPYPPDAQLAAYVNALPTRALPAPGGVSGHEAGQGGPDEDGASPHAGAGGRDLSSGGDDKASSFEDDQQQSHKKGKKGGASDDSDNDDDKDDDGSGPPGGPPKGGPKRKLFGGDDDSCLPELLRKNLQPKTPTASTAARGTDIASSP